MLSFSLSKHAATIYYQGADSKLRLKLDHRNGYLSFSKELTFVKHDLFENACQITQYVGHKSSLFGKTAKLGR